MVSNNNDNGNAQFKGIGQDSSQSKEIPGETLIFSRILGHLEIPRSHKWQESQECWIC
jgi:hypothetical protein